MSLTITNHANKRVKNYNLNLKMSNLVNLVPQNLLPVLLSIHEVLKKRGDPQAHKICPLKNVKTATMKT